MPLLPISHRQQQRPADCLAACAAMVLDHLHVSVDYESLIKTLRISPEGASFRNLRHLESLGLSVLIERGEIETLRLHLERGLPPIAFVATGQLSYWDEATGHAVVVAGLEGETIYLNDPAFANAPKAVPVDEFELAWIDLDQFYALIELR